jgi:putative membrane protein
VGRPLGEAEVIQYDRASWWRVVFSLRGTVLPHVLFRVGLLTALALAVAWVYEFVPGDEKGNKPGLPELGHSILGVALGMLIVFRTNSSNDRFWEARALWGSLVNTARNLARGAAAYTGQADDLSRLIGAYVVMVREQLRGNSDPEVLRPILPGRVVDRLRGAGNPASVLAGQMSEWIAERVRSGRLDPVMAVRLEQLVGGLLDAQGGCERILKTPLPFVYAALIKQALFMYLATLPLVLVPRMGYLAPLAVAGVALCMLGIEEAGIEIECPFGADPNHLPLEGICDMIGRDTADLARMIGRYKDDALPAG